MYYSVELPWGFPRPKTLVFDAEKKTWFYRGPILPAELRPFQSVEFSRERWHEDEKNGLVSPITPGTVQFTPKPHQLDAAKAIAAAYQNGWSGFLLADKTGIGKTLSSLVGLALISKMEGRNVGKKATVLIVCPKGAIPVWRQTLRSYRMAHPLLRPLIMNYEQLQKLLSSPPQARVNPKKSRKSRQIARDGAPMISFDYIVFDEAHYLKNYPSSNVSLIASKIAGLDKSYRKGTSPFVLFCTATPGSTPLNFSVMAGFMSKLINPKLTKHVGPKEWGEFLIQEKFEVTKGKSGYNWATIPWFGKDSNTPAEKAKYEKGVKEAKLKQRKDAQRIGRALTTKGAPFIMRSPKDIVGWPEQQTVPLPIELTPKQKQYYKEAWTQFRTWLNLTPAKKDPKSALVQQLRYRQKTSILRVEAIAAMTKDWVDEGKQVYISVEFIETLDKFLEYFGKAKISVAEISGRNPEEREEQRLRFQKGAASVIISTSVASISFHSNEQLADGTKATSAERVTILADIRQNPLDSLQALGRAHRNGEDSVAYIPYIEDTVDEKIVTSLINKIANQDIMTGSSVEDAEELERVFRLAAAKTTSPSRLS
jgi:SNF2 family DNA or RNA helicase